MAVRFTYHGSPFAQQIQQQGFKSGTPSGSLRIGNRAITLADLFQKGPKAFTSTSPKVASMYGSNIPVASSTRNLSLPSGGITGSGVRFGTEVVQTPGQFNKGMNVANKALDRAARGVSPTATRLAGGATVSGLGAPGGASLLSRLTGGPLGVASLVGTGIGYGADQIARATNTPEEYEAMKEAARAQGGFGYFDDVDISQDAATTTTPTGQRINALGQLEIDADRFLPGGDLYTGISTFEEAPETYVGGKPADVFTGGRPSMADIAGEINENLRDLGNPTGDPRIGSEEQGLSGFPGIGPDAMGTVDPGFQNVLDAREARRNEIAMQQNPDYGQFFDAAPVNEPKRGIDLGLLGLLAGPLGMFTGSNALRGIGLAANIASGRAGRGLDAARTGIGSLGSRIAGRMRGINPNTGRANTQAEYEANRANRSLAKRQANMIARKNAGKTYSSKNLAEVTRELNRQNTAREKAKTQKSQNPNLRSGANSGGGGRSKIVCTMMNERYGFGSFRNKIWMKFHEHHGPEYQKGYHAIFLPLVKIAKGEGKINTAVRKVLEHMGRHVTADMFKIMKGKKRDTLGRIYRAIFEPACHIIGKIKSALGRG